MNEEANLGPRFFSRTVLMFLAPLFLSILIVGFFSTRQTVSSVRENAHAVNSLVLRQTRSEIDSILEELSIISLNFTINPRVQQSLGRILRKAELGYEDLQELEFIRNMLNISHYSRGYIHSIYVYFNNDRGQFLTSEAAVTSRDAFHDTGWLESYSTREGGLREWNEVRSVRTYPLSGQETTVLTFYKRIYSSTKRDFTGVVVINVDRDSLRDSLEVHRTFDDQAIYIIDPERKIVVANSRVYDALVPAVLDDEREVFEVRHEGRTFTIGRIRSRYDFTCITIVPNATIYALTEYLWKQNLFYVLASLVLGVSLSLYMARVSSRQIRTVIDIIRSAREGKLKPIPVSGIRSSYQYVLYSLINTFVEKDYLQARLSERMLKSRVDELVALQSQINPHFLFNTLETINMKALGLSLGGANDVSRMIGHLATLLRYSLDDPGHLATLEQEILHAKSYLAIQSVRYRDRISVRWDYDERVGRYRTIRLLFQPLLENSIYHGIREREGPGEISVAIREGDSTLSISVSDTGIGIPAARLTEIREKLAAGTGQFEHIGLYNTNRRIRLTFGERYGITVESAPGQGTRVEILLPAILEE